MKFSNWLWFGRILRRFNGNEYKQSMFSPFSFLLLQYNKTSSRVSNHFWNDKCRKLCRRLAFENSVWAIFVLDDVDVGRFNPPKKNVMILSLISFSFTNLCHSIFGPEYQTSDRIDIGYGKNANKLWIISTDAFTNHFSKKTIKIRSPIIHLLF